MRRVIWAIAKKSLTKGSHLKTNMSKVTLGVSLLFILFFFLYLLSYVQLFFSSIMPENEYRPVSISPLASLFSTDALSGSESVKSGQLLLVNVPESFLSFLESEMPDAEVYGISGIIREKSGAYFDFLTYQDRIDTNTADLVLVFPEDFDRQMVSLSGGTRPQILTYYDPSDSASKTLHDAFTDSLLPDYGEAVQSGYGRAAAESPAFNVNPEEVSGTADNSLFGSKRIISHMILPLVLFITIMYAAMESGMATVAGEKERGTFAAILLTPVRSIEIVLGNALGILLRSMIPAGICILVLTAVFGYFAVGPILYLFILCLSLSLLMTALVLIISIMNRSILTAQASFLPIFFILLIVCVTAMQTEGNPGISSFLLPFYGHYYGIAAALDGTYSLTILLALCGICAILTVILLLLSDRLLHIERFTTYIEDNQDIQKEALRKRKERLILQRSFNFPQNRIFGYQPKRVRPALRLLSYHFQLPVYLLLIFQSAAVIFPLLMYLKSDASTVFFTSFESAGGDLTLMLGLVMKLFSNLMKTKFFVAAMGAGYVLVIFVYVLIIRFLEKQPMASAGLPFDSISSRKKAVTSYGRGLLIGFAMMLGVFLLLIAAGQIRVTGFGLSADAASLFGIYILMWIPQGACEELMFRGYMLPRLSVRFGRVVSVLFTSVFFSLMHMGNGGFSVIAFINLILIAGFFALLSLHTNEIWTVCAAHSVWNFAQGNIFGLEVSGNPSAARLLRTSYAGDSISYLTGGDFGPEGGPIVTAVILLCLLILFLIRHRIDKSTFS